MAIKLIKARIKGILALLYILLVLHFFCTIYINLKIYNYLYIKLNYKTYFFNT